jgi:hypothetical protein
MVILEERAEHKREEMNGMISLRKRKDTWKSIKKNNDGCKGLDWIHLSQNKEQCRALVITVANFQYP